MSNVEEDIYILFAMPGNITDIGNYILHEEAMVLHPKTTEQWELEKTIKLCEDANKNANIKIIIVPSTSNECFEYNKTVENPVSHDELQHWYNNYVMTIGWLYMEHSEKIINSTHL